MWCPTALGCCNSTIRPVLWLWGGWVSGCHGISDSNGRGIPSYNALIEGPDLPEIWGTTWLLDEAFGKRPLMHPEDWKRYLYRCRVSLTGHVLHSLRLASSNAYVRRQSPSKRLADDVRCAMRILSFRTHTKRLDRSRGGSYAHWTKRLLPKGKDGCVLRRQIEGMASHGVKHFFSIEPCVQTGTPTVPPLF